MLAQRPVVDAPVTAAVHRAAAVGPDLDGEEAGLVRPVLEDAPRGEQALQFRFVVCADAAREREPVRPVDRRDRVELDRPEPPDSTFDVAGSSVAEARRVALGGHHEPPDRGEADGYRRHRPLPTR